MQSTGYGSKQTFLSEIVFMNYKCERIIYALPPRLAFVFLRSNLIRFFHL